MAQRINAPVVVVPANTPKLTPVAFAFSWPEGIVRTLEIDIPPGPSGLVGFFLTHSGTQVIPEGSGQFIISDNRFFSWPVEQFPTGGKWACVAYNTDVYDHQLQFHFLIDDIPEMAPSPAPLITIE